MAQYGFFFDQSRCRNCGACSVACRDWYDIPPGPVKWLKIHEWEKGSFPNVRLYVVALPCLHCENPVCVDAANGAMYKEEKYGAVLIDTDKATSIDLRRAQEACQYGAIAFDSDSMTASASKCTMCIDRLEQGMNPVCVESCPMRAFDFGPLSDLFTKYGTNRDLEDLPSSTLTNPAVVFKPHTAKKQLISYDATRALQLLAKRDPLPAIFSSPADATDIPDGLVRRNKPILKPRNVAEAIAASKNDEG